MAWLKRLLGIADATLERLSDAVERFTALMCAALVVPLALVADVVLLVLGDPGEGWLGSRIGLDQWVGTYLAATAAPAGLVALYSAFATTPRAARLAHWLDRAMLPIAYTASALLALFAGLMWVR